VSIDPPDKITLLDAMIRLGYRGKSREGWLRDSAGVVLQSTAKAERRAMQLHQAVAENGFSYRAMVTAGTMAHLSRFLGPYG
jgi:hypothetical protein